MEHDHIVSERRPRSGLSVLAALVAVMTIAGIGVAVLLLTTDQTTTGTENPEQPAPPAEAALLTEAEAIAEFERLYEEMLEVVEARDISSLARITTPSGPARENLTETVEQHRADQVIEQSTIRFASIEVLSIESDEFEVRVRDVVHPCFRSEEGRDVTRGPGEIRHTSVWKVVKTMDLWLLHEGVVEDFEERHGVKAGC